MLAGAVVVAPTGTVVVSTPSETTVPLRSASPPPAPEMTTAPATTIVRATADPTTMTVWTALFRDRHQSRARLRAPNRRPLTVVAPAYEVTVPRVPARENRRHRRYRSSSLPESACRRMRRFGWLPCHVPLFSASALTSTNAFRSQYYAIRETPSQYEPAGLPHRGWCSVVRCTLPESTQEKQKARKSGPSLW